MKKNILFVLLFFVLGINLYAINIEEFKRQNKINFEIDLDNDGNIELISLLAHGKKNQIEIFFRENESYKKISSDVGFSQDKNIMYYPPKLFKISTTNNVFLVVITNLSKILSGRVITQAL